MGVIQEKRLDAPMPQVDDTEYGAQYVEAATEKPVEAIPAAEEVNDEAAVSTEAEHPVRESAVEEMHVEAPKEKKKGGRPRKSVKKNG